MLIKSTSNYDDLDEMVLGEFAGAPRAAGVLAPNPQDPAPEFQPTLIAEEVVEPPQFMAKPRSGFGTRLAAAVLQRSPSEQLDARITDMPRPAGQVRAGAQAPQKEAPVAAPVPAPADAKKPREAQAGTSQGSAKQQNKPVGREVAPAAPRRALTARARPALITMAAVSALVVTAWAGFSAGQKSLARPSTVTTDTVAATSAAPAFGLATPIAVAASRSALASASAPEAASSSVLAPDSVLAAASANLPPMASLPPAIDEHKVDQRQPAARSATPVPAAPSTSAPAQTGAQQPDGLIALGGDSQQAATTDHAAAAPTNAGAQDAKHTGSPRPATPPAPATTKADPADQGAAGNVRKMKYGSMGITALTATSVVLVDGKRGQFAVSRDQALPDGSIVQSVDPRNHRIITNRGVIQLD